MFITKTELKLYFSRSLLLGALLLAALALTAGYLGSHLLYEDSLVPKFTLYIVDNDNTMESKMLLEALRDFNSDTMTVVTGTESGGRQAVEDGAAAAALIIPNNFFADIMSGKNSGASLYISRENEVVAEVIELFADSIKEQLSASQAGIYYILSKAADNGQYISFMNESNIIFFSVFMSREMEEEMVSPFGAASNSDYYIFSFYVFTMFLLPSLLIENSRRIKETQVLALLSSKGIGIFYVYCFKLLSLIILFGALNIPFMGLMVITGALSGIGALWLLALFLLLTSIQSAVCALFIWLFDDVKTAGASVFLIGIGALFFSGGILPIVFLPEAIRGFSRLTPNYYIIDIFISMKSGVFHLLDGMPVVLFSLLALAASFLAAYFRGKNAKGGRRNEFLGRFL